MKPEWSPEGITLIGHDVVTFTLTVAVNHMSEFAVFGAEKPIILSKYYLPLVTCKAEFVGSEP